MKVAVRFALTLAVVLLAVVFVGPSLINWNSLKPQIEAHLERVLGRDVTLGGNISASFLPEPHLEANDVTIANAPGGAAPNLLHLKTLQGQIALVPLLSGRLVVKGLKLVEPVVTLERMKDGAFNFSFAALDPPDGHTLALYERKEAGPGRFLVFDPQDVSIDKIEVVKGTLNYVDHVLDAEETLSALDGVLSAATLNGPYTGEAGFAWQGRRWGVGGEVAAPKAQGLRELSFKLTEAGSLLKGALIGRLAHPPAGKSDDKAQNVPWTVTGALTLHADRPEGFWQGAAADPPRAFALEGALAVDPQGAKVKDMAMRWGDFTANGVLALSFAGTPRYSITASGHALDLDALLPPPEDEKSPLWLLALMTPPEPAAAPAPADAQDETPGDATAPAAPPRDLLSAFDGDFDLKLASLTFRKGEVTALAAKGKVDDKGITLDAARARLPGKSELGLKGTLVRAESGLGYDGALALASEDARALLAWCGFDVGGVADDRLKRLAYDGAVSLEPGQLILNDFKAGLDGAQAEGTLFLVMSNVKARPKIKGELEFTRANLAPYRSLFFKNDARGFIEQADDLVSAIDGALDVRVESLALDGADASGVTAHLRMSDGWIHTGQISIDDLDGAEMSLTMEDTHALAGQASLNWHGEASGPNLRPLLDQWHLGWVRGDAPLGPFSISLEASLQNGNGAVAMDGNVSGAEFTVGSDLKSIAAPLRGTLGPDGQIITTVVADSDHAGELGALLGFGGHATGSDATASLNLRTLVAEEKREFALSAMVGNDIARLSWQRQGKGENANYDFDLSAKANDASITLAALGAAPDVLHHIRGPFALRVAGKGPAKEITLSTLDYQLQDEEAHGTGMLDFSGDRARATASVETTRIDLGRYIGAFGLGLVEEGKWRTSPIALDGLGRFDADVALKSKTIALAGSAVHDAALDVSLKDGTLKLDNVKADWGGGALTANAVLRGGEALPGFAIAAKFAGVDARDVAVALLGQTVATGRIDGTLTLKGQGATAEALAKAASGELKIKATGGTVEGFDLDTFARRRAALHTGDDPAPVLGALSGGESPMTACDLAFTIDEGIVQTRAGIIDFPQGRALLTGTIDLGARTYALALNLPATGLPATPHIVVSGPVNAPEVTRVSTGVADALKAEAATHPVPPPKEEVPETPAPEAVSPPDVLPPGEPERLHDLIQSLPSKTQ